MSGLRRAAPTLRFVAWIVNPAAALSKHCRRFALRYTSQLKTFLLSNSPAIPDLVGVRSHECKARRRAECRSPFKVGGVEIHRAIYADDGTKEGDDVTEKIPRRIIQVWGHSANLPLLAKAGITNMRLLNPDFEHLFFDDARIEDFIDHEFPEYRPVFDSFSARIQSYDLFRYLAVYRLGGFYFDTDVLLASGLDDLLEFSCVFPFEHLSIHSFLSEEYGMDWEIGNYAFGAAAGHPFLGAIIKNCIRAQQTPEWAEGMMKSIPPNLPW